MASIRKRNGSYLIVVSMGYDYDGNRRKPRQKTVRPPEGMTPKQLEKLSLYWLARRVSTTLAISWESMAPMATG